VHLRPHAGTDGALALALANVIITEGLADTEYISERTTGIEAYQASVADWTPERAAAETGVAADDIAALAREYASARPAAVRLGVGMQRSTGAGAALRAIQCLTELTGQRRWPAGGIASAESIGQLNLPALSRPDLVPPGTREVNMIQLGRVLTDRGLDPPIRSLFVWNSNPAVIAADQQRVIAGLRRDDLFTVVHDLFLTDTARHADIVLPATSMLEHPDLVGSWGFWYVSWNEAAIEPVGESKSNAEVARLLAAHLGLDDDVFGLDDHQLMELAIADSRASHGGMQPDQLRDEGFIRVGPRPDAPAHDESTFAFEDDRLLDVGMNPVVDYVPPANRPGVANGHTLRLLTLKRHYSINTSYGNLPVMLNAEPDAIVEIHPDDAARRRIGDGDDVRIYNDLGSIRARADITDRTPAGTVGVPFGRWNHDPASGGVNSLTSDALGDLANGPTFCDNLVEVELVDGPR
jgi:anaerobic selenocysteine-containing dehydrogenase